MAELLNDATVADPILPGSYFIFEATRQATPEASVGSTMFVPITADWGPDGVVVPLDDFDDYVSGSDYVLPGGQKFTGFGPSDTAGRRAVLDAFLGEGIPGRGGAGRVIAYRLAASAAAKAVRVMQNTAGNPGLTLTADYKGTYGNGYTFTLRAIDGSTNELVLIRAGVEVTTMPHVATDTVALAAAINASTDWPFQALANVPAVALQPVVAGAVTTNGADGTAYTAGDYTAMLAALEFEPFTVFSAHGLTDSTITASVVAWMKSVRQRGKRMMLGLGGAAAEAYASHKARATGLNDPDILCFGTGSISASEYSLDGSSVTISTAEGITRVMAAVARRGGLLDMVNVRFSGWSIIGGATRDQAKSAATSGMSLLTRDGDDQAPTKINLGVTSYTGNTDKLPNQIYSVVKFVRTLHLLEQALTEDQEGGGDELIDGRGVDSKSRDLVAGRAASVLKTQFVDAGMLLPESSVVFDPQRPPKKTDKVVSLLYTANFVPGLRGIRNRIQSALTS